MIAKPHQFVGQMLSDLGGAASITRVRIGDALGFCEMNPGKFVWVVGFAILVGVPPGVAEASSIMTSISACGPSATVQQVTQPIPPPSTLNSSCSSLHFGDAAVTVDPVHGIISGTLSTPMTRNLDGSVFDLGELDAFGVIQDTFRFIGTGTITAQFVVTGTGTVPPVDSFDDAAGQ